MEKFLRPYSVTNFQRTNFQIEFKKVVVSGPILLGIALLFFVSIVKAQALPDGFSQVMVANGISDPTVIAFAPDGRIFVAQQTGQLRIIKNGTLLPQPFISLSVSSSGERGLLGIAFDPNFNSNHFIYLYYTLPSAANNRISRFTANGDVVVPGSELVLLDLDPLSGATNHNGGTMQFGPDGKLYIGVGENADAINSQNTDTYHGKLLRINPDGSVPPGNPFTTGSAQQQRIWSYGLRNPYTISFQPGTGKLFVNDVGSSVWEEINDASVGGKNYGWPYEEGNGSQFSDPVYAYPHGSGNASGCAITGGTFFNPSSTNYPPSYVGKYFFLDYCSNWIDMLTLDGGTPTESNFASNIAGSPVSLVTGTDGNLYFLSRDNSAVYKITHTDSSAPVITNQPQSLRLAQGNSAAFNVSATGEAPLSYQWKRNGTNINGATNSVYTVSSVTSANAGVYSVVVSNSSGSISSSNVTLQVLPPNKAPTATITTPSAGATYAAGDTINFSGTATDPESGNLGGTAYTWYVLFNHETHTHPGPSATKGAASGSFKIPNTGETASNVFYRLYLVVTDPQGAKDTAYTDILPRTSTITLNSNPQGLSLMLDGQPFTAPLTVTSVEGFLRTIGAASPQTINGVTYSFSNWSQSGFQTQTITTPGNNVIYTASFTHISPVVITGQPQSVAVLQGNAATFNVTATGTAPLTYQWRKNGVNISSATQSSYTIAAVTISSAGNYSVVVSNASGSVTSSSAELTVTVPPNQAPSATIITPVAGTTYAGGNIISFSGSGSDPETGTLNPNSYNWYVKFYHDSHELPGPAVTFGVQSSFFTIPNNGETGTNVFYRLYLVVTDDQGATDTAFVDILARTSTFTINTNPQGLAVILDGQSFNAPLSVESVEGIIRTISTPSPQVLNGLTFYFNNWSQGGEQAQLFVTAPNDTVYTANFVNDQPVLLRNPDNPSNTVNGLDYSYHHGTWDTIPDFTTVIKEKAGTISNFDLSPRTESDNFGFHFTGYVYVPVDGQYTFYTSSDAGSKLYIGSVVIVDNDGVHDMQERSGQIGLKAGKHQITVDYFEQTLQQGLTVSYEGPGIIKQLIPDTVLFRVVPDLFVLTPLADASVRSGSYDSINIGASPILNIGNTNENYETYLRFDISGVRTGFSSARLRLYGGVSGINASPVSLDAYNVNSINWLESTITNINKPPADQTVVASTIITVSAGQYYDWDLTQYIENLRNSGKLYFSLLIKNQTNTNNELTDFNSKENTANKPELKIEYLPLITQAKGVRTVNTIAKSIDKITGNGNASFSIYPNPAANNFTLKYSPEFRNRRLRIVDANGKQLKEVLLTGTGSQNIKVGNLKNGLYFIYMDANGKRYSQKVMIRN